MDMTLIAFCILFVCKVSVGLKGRREKLRRTSGRTFKLEQRPEKPWAISWLPDLQVRDHDKSQLRSVPASLLFPLLLLRFTCWTERTQPKNKRPSLSLLLFCYFVEIPRLFSAKQSVLKSIMFTAVPKNVDKVDILLRATLGL